MTRVPLRLTLAVAGSIAVHAAAVSLYSPAGGAAARNTLTPVLHAVLAPADAEPSAAHPRDNGKTSDGNGGSGGAARDGLPVPEQWFKRSELDRVASPVTAVKLDYPESAKADGAARIQVRLFIDERGMVRKITLEERGPERAFEEAAVKAWQRVRFSPAMKDGVAVKSQQVIEVEFQPELALR